MSTVQEFDTGLGEADIDPERPRALETPFGTMALFSVAGEVLCVQAFCPHLEGPLFQGTVSGDTVTCPWHRWRYDLRTGERIYPHRVVDPDGCTIERLEVAWSERRTILLRKRGETQ
jgi:nitrite reductase/ring-hydroxylating ferredoxin subunit